MANRSGGRGRPPRAVQPARTPVFPEPEVRRWPHPVEGAAPPSAGEANPSLYYIQCALSYQNQLLADIKALLEQLAGDSAPAAEPRTEEGRP